MQDEAGHLIGEYDGSGNLVEETVWLGDIPVATLVPNGSGGVQHLLRAHGSAQYAAEDRATEHWDARLAMGYRSVWNGSTGQQSGGG
jgi:hypothetical protein